MGVASWVLGGLVLLAVFAVLISTFYDASSEDDTTQQDGECIQNDMQKMYWPEARDESDAKEKTMNMLSNHGIHHAFDEQHILAEISEDGIWTTRLNCDETVDCCPEGFTSIMEPFVEGFTGELSLSALCLADSGCAASSSVVDHGPTCERPGDLDPHADGLYGLVGSDGSAQPDTADSKEARLNQVLQENELSLTRDTFNVKVKCGDGYSGTDAASNGTYLQTQCDEHDPQFHIIGQCTQDCQAPANLQDSHIQISGQPNYSFNADNFNVTYECVDGWSLENSDSTAQASKCSAGGGSITFPVNCVQDCQDPINTRGYNIEAGANKSSSDAFDVNVTCDDQEYTVGQREGPDVQAHMYVPSGDDPTATRCANPGGEYTLSGCIENVCTKPASSWAGAYHFEQSNYSCQTNSNGCVASAFEMKYNCHDGYSYEWCETERCNTDRASGEGPEWDSNEYIDSECLEAGLEASFPRECESICTDPDDKDEAWKFKQEQSPDRRLDSSWWAESAQTSGQSSTPSNDIECAAGYTAPNGIQVTKCANPGEQYTVSGCVEHMCTLPINCENSNAYDTLDGGPALGGRTSGLGRCSDINYVTLFQRLKYPETLNDNREVAAIYDDNKIHVRNVGADGARAADGGTEEFVMPPTPEQDSGSEPYTLLRDVTSTQPGAWMRGGNLLKYGLHGLASNYRWEDGTRSDKDFSVCETPGTMINVETSTMNCADPENRDVEFTILPNSGADLDQRASHWNLGDQHIQCKPSDIKEPDSTDLRRFHADNPELGIDGWLKPRAEWPSGSEQPLDIARCGEVGHGVSSPYTVSGCVQDVCTMPDSPALTHGGELEVGECHLTENQNNDQCKDFYGYKLYNEMKVGEYSPFIGDPPLNWETPQWQGENATGLDTPWDMNSLKAQNNPNINSNPGKLYQNLTYSNFNILYKCPPGKTSTYRKDLEDAGDINQSVKEKFTGSNWFTSGYIPAKRCSEPGQPWELNDDASAQCHAPCLHPGSGTAVDGVEAATSGYQDVLADLPEGQDPPSYNDWKSPLLTAQDNIQWNDPQGAGGACGEARRGCGRSSWPSAIESWRAYNFTGGDPDITWGGFNLDDKIVRGEVVCSLAGGYVEKKDGISVDKCPTGGTFYTLYGCEPQCGAPDNESLYNIDALSTPERISIYTSIAETPAGQLTRSRPELVGGALTEDGGGITITCNIDTAMTAGADTVLKAYSCASQPDKGTGPHSSPSDYTCNGNGEDQTCKYSLVGCFPKQSEDSEVANVQDIIYHADPSYQTIKGQTEQQHKVDLVETINSLLLSHNATADDISYYNKYVYEDTDDPSKGIIIVDYQVKCAANDCTIIEE